MNKLDIAREKINKIDKQMADLFCERMKATEMVADYKKENGLPIFDPERENTIIDDNSKKLSNPQYAQYYVDFQRDVMKISRKYQEKLLEGMKIAYSGVEGAFAHIAAGKIFSSGTRIAFSNFKEAYQAVNNGECDCVVLPIENSSAGEVGSVINLDLAERSYNIYIEKGSLNNLGKFFLLDRKVLIVTDDGVPAKYAQTVAKQCKSPVVVTVKQGEGSKSFDTLRALCSTMLENNFTRNDCVVAVGGGVIGDLSGFAAASYMRGIDFYNIPTTVLSQVDSSIGGKVAINLDDVKNIVGAFYQPKAVLIDTQVLETLSDRQISNGLAEAVKMGLTSDETLFDLLESGNPRENIDQIIYKSLMVKKQVVEQDEKENGLRRVLNFGHTIGHAIETLNLGELFHGECVALGMLYMCESDVRERLKKVLTKLNLPTEVCLEKLRVKTILEHDKKSAGEYITAVFVDKIGSFEFKNVTSDELVRLL